MTRTNVRAKARGLGAELADLRTKANLTLRAVAERLGWSAPTLSRIENGVRDSTSEEVAALLVVYGVTGAKNDRLIELARTIDQSYWIEHNGPRELPTQLRALIEFESTATRLTDVAISLVPGLLQTADYARAVFESGGVASNTVQRRVDVRLSRQDILKPASGPELHAILDECVLRRPLGGRQVMADQVRHLIAASARPNITIQILRQVAHPALTGSFYLLEFEPPAQPLVHLEHYRSSSFMDDDETVKAYKSVSGELAAMALDERASREFMARLVRSYEAKRE